tara:strand:- start:698 stop:1813 length:1116 start_codon:yes stop_codon:yes gene_type:complete
MPKILFVVNSDSFFISHRLPIALNAQRKGFEVHILTGLSDQGKEIHSHKFKVYGLNIKKTSTNPINFCFSLFRVFKVLIDVKPDILHLITIKPIIWGGLASKLFKPKVVIASVTGLGQVYTDKRLSSFFIKKFIEIIYKISYSDKKNKFFIFQNNYDKKYIKGLLKLNKEKIIMTNGAGVYLHQFKPKPFPKGEPVFLFASRLLNAKGVLEFIEAANLVKNGKFIIAGEYDPRNRDSIDKKILEKAILERKITFLGYIKNIADVINKSSVVVLPSYYGEGLPKILIEASACGRPIITTNLPGCKDTIINGKTGYFAKAKSSNDLIKKINIFIRNPEKIYEMGKQSRKLAEKKFDINEVIKKHIILYKLFQN